VLNANGKGKRKFVGNMINLGRPVFFLLLLIFEVHNGKKNNLDEISSDVTRCFFFSPVLLSIFISVNVGASDDRLQFVGEKCAGTLGVVLCVLMCHTEGRLKVSSYLGPL
jgi:hypothetical protein